MAAFGAQRFAAGVAYLATVDAHGAPRLHPVTPIVGDELYLFMEPSSPKGKDLQRGSRYSLHCAVANMAGGEGEFYVRGQAARVQDYQRRAQAAAAAAYAPAERYILFALSIESVFLNVYVNGEPQVQRWRAAA